MISYDRAEEYRVTVIENGKWGLDPIVEEICADSLEELVAEVNSRNFIDPDFSPVSLATSTELSFEVLLHSSS